jgi:Na+/H+-dicarboxylate symporter
MLYVASVNGIALPLPRVLLSVGFAALLSLATTGISSAVGFNVIVIPLCLSANLPIAILPILLSVEPILDCVRTFGNVTASLAVTVWAGRWATQPRAERTSAREAS